MLMIFVFKTVKGFKIIDLEKKEGELYLSNMLEDMKFKHSEFLKTSIPLSK